MAIVYDHLKDVRTKANSLRTDLLYFAEEMEAKLRKNDHKTEARLLPPEALLRKLQLELEEFKVAYEYETPEAARWELVDIANFCMLLHYRMREDHV